VSEQYEALTAMLPEIQRAARSVAFKWPLVTTAEDLAQDIFLRLMDTAGSVSKLSEMAPNGRMSSLTRIGHQIASGDRDDLEYFSGQFAYSVEEVKRLLIKGGLTVELEGFDAAVFDLRQAMEALKVRNINQANAIIQRYTLEVPPDKDVLSRGIESLTVLMNRARSSQESEFRNGGRRRNVRRNTAWVREMEEAYEGGSDADE
jgi:DNA-directed RNA polymerase specialized sigma24 family protein